MRWLLLIIVFSALGCAKVAGPTSDGGSDFDGGGAADACPELAKGQWHKLGETLSMGDSTTGPKSVDLTTDAEGRTLVAWTEGSPSGLFVSRFDTSWSPVATDFGLNGGETSLVNPTIATRGGRIVVGFLEQDDQNQYHAHLAQSDGGAFSALGAALNDNRISTSAPDLTIAESGDVYTAFAQTEQGQTSGRFRLVTTRTIADGGHIRLNPEQGGIAGAGASISYPQVALTSSGRLVTAFSESSDSWAAIRNLDNDDWDYIGGEIGAGLTFGTKLALRASDDAVFVLLSEFIMNGTRSSRVYRSDGNGNWLEAVSHDELPGFDTPYDLAFDNDGGLVAAYREGENDVWKLFVGRGAGGSRTSAEVPVTTDGALISAAMDYNAACGSVDVAVFDRDAADVRYVSVYRWVD